LAGDGLNKKYVVSGISEGKVELRVAGSTDVVKIAKHELQTVIPVSVYIHFAAILMRSTRRWEVK